MIRGGLFGITSAPKPLEQDRQKKSKESISLTAHVYSTRDGGEPTQ